MRIYLFILSRNEPSTLLAHQKSFYLGVPEEYLVSYVYPDCF